ncbi:MAG: DUF3034 family protein [Planctomycetota bacterium]
MRSRSVVLALFLVPLIASAAFADEKKEPLPIPLHTVEGVGGHFTVESAYLVNPAPPGELLGKPAFGFMTVHLGHGKHLESASFTETFADRLELGYAANYLTLGDVPEDIERAFADAVTVDRHALTLHHMNARLLAVKEGEFSQPWMPAVTVGYHYKVNDGTDSIDRDLGGGLTDFGIRSDRGWDVTVTASKTILSPVVFTLTGTARYTKAAHIGLLGFTEKRRWVGEFAICAPIYDGIFLAAEYRMKPSEYDETHGLLGDEDDWWTIDTCIVATSRLTIAAGYGHFGKVLNHTANRVFGLAVKYEF